MNTKTKRKPIARLMAVLMALAMVVSVVFIQGSAAKANFDPPTSPMTIDENQITVAAHSQGYITPEVLGLTNTTSRAMELPANTDGTVGMTLDNAQKMAVLGVFGSDINENPNPYLYNYFYNVYAQAEGLKQSGFGTYTLSKDVGGGPNGAAASGGYLNTKLGVTVPASLYKESDILLGINPIDKSAGTTGYTNALKAYNAAKKAREANAEEYNPIQVAYEMTHVYSFLQTLYDLSDEVDKIQEEQPTKTTRYGDPQVISGDIEKYVKGLEAYVMKKLKEDGATPLTVAVVDTAYTDTLMQAGTIKAGQYVVNDKTCSTQATTNFSRVGEFVADTATNIIDALPTKPERKAGADTNNFKNEYYVVTADQIADYADVVLFCDVLSSVPENQGNSKVDNFKQDVASNCSTAARKEKVKEIQMMSSAFDCVGSIGANSVENILGMAYYTAYLYPQYLNQFEVAAYWYQNFYHVSDLNKLNSVMKSNFATSSVQDDYADKYSASKLTYDKDDMEAKIIEGMNYYEANEEEFKGKLIYQNGKTGEDTGWVIDWTRGIGAGQQACTAGGTHVVVSLPAKAATCTEAGLTEGQKCSACGQTLLAQSRVPAKGHTFIVDTEAKEATCTEAGNTVGRRCHVCGYEEKSTTIPALGHIHVDLAAVEPTCTETGLTKGDWCSTCGTIWTAQEEVPALGHNYVDGKCTRCEEKEPAPVEPETKLNGLAKGTDGKWAMYKDDVVQKNYTGLAKSTYNGQWYYVKNGYLDWNYTGFGQNVDTKKWYRVKEGRVDWNANGIYKKPETGAWYKTNQGRVTWNETGIYKNFDNNTWWYVENSRITFKANGVYKNKANGTWWKVKNSNVDFSFNGLASNQNGTWKIKNGKVDFGYSGTYQGKTIKNGKVV